MHQFLCGLFRGLRRLVCHKVETRCMCVCRVGQETLEIFHYVESCIRVFDSVSLFWDFGISDKGFYVLLNRS